MVEPIMYLAIGFLVSMLCGLMVMPLVHNRAVRLTTKRLEAATPLSMAEIQADKDQLRAEFAMSARRLEMSVEQLKSRTTSQLAELGKKSDAINRLKHELGEKNATIFSLEAREKAVKEQLRATEEEFAAKTQALRTAEAALAEKQSELGKLSGDLSERSTLAETRQAELLAVRAQIEALQTRVSDAEQEFGESRTRLEEHRAQSSAASAELIGARERVETLSGRVGDLDRQLMLQVKEAELLGNRVADLEGRLATQGKILAERDYENNLLKQQFDAAKEAERVLRAEIASLSSSAGVDKILAEKAAIETQLRAARDERAAAQRELNAMQSQAEASWATERMENALLRERINDIAAEVAKLASQLEGPDSPIDAILASDAATARLAPASESGGMEATGTLAERIRALQSHASRARQAN